MTREEAIKILNPGTRRETLHKIPVFERIDADQEACRIAVAALRAQQEPAKLDRSRWEAHPVIKRRPYRSERFEEFKLSEDGEVLYRKVVTIHEDWTEDYCSACGKKLCSRFTSYCPNCGRPLTEEAWAELERRMNGGTADIR